MDEAERLCDRVMLVHQDRVAALDTSARLAERAGDGTHMTFLPSAPFLDEVLTHLAGVSSRERAGERIRVTGTGDLVPTVLEAWRTRS